jgi:glycosyltransferase involved in cell wall biosynthesis
MASGRPIVAAVDKDTETARLIAESNCGLSLPAEDPDALAAAVLQLSNNPALCSTMGESGRTLAETLYSREVGSRRYHELIRSLIERKR